MQLTYTAKKRKISLTALIDVVFILLMFFMLTTQFVQWQSVPLQLSQSQSTSQLNPMINALIIHQNGQITFTGQTEIVAQFAQQKHFSDYTQADFTGLTLSQELKLHPYSQTTVKTLLEAIDYFKSIGIHLSIGSQILEADDSASQAGSNR